MIELNTINPNVNSFVHSRTLGPRTVTSGCEVAQSHCGRILFEFPAAGGVLIRQEARVVFA